MSISAPRRTRIYEQQEVLRRLAEPGATSAVVLLAPQSVDQALRSPEPGLKDQLQGALRTPAPLALGPPSGTLRVEGRALIAEGAVQPPLVRFADGSVGRLDGELPSGAEVIEQLKLRAGDDGPVLTYVDPCSGETSLLYGPQTWRWLKDSAQAEPEFPQLVRRLTQSEAQALSAELLARAEQAELLVPDSPLAQLKSAIELDRRYRQEAQDPVARSIAQAGSISKTKLDQVLGQEFQSIPGKRWVVQDMLQYADQAQFAPLVGAIYAEARPQVSPALLYTTFMLEGGNAWADRATNLEGFDPREPASTTDHLGLDLLLMPEGTVPEHPDMNRPADQPTQSNLRARGYLRAPPEFVLLGAKNLPEAQGDRTVYQGVAPLSEALRASAATLAFDADLARADFPELWRKANAEQRGALTYLYFNVGAAYARKAISRHGMGIFTAPTRADPSINNGLLNMQTRYRALCALRDLGVFAAP